MEENTKGKSRLGALIAAIGVISAIIGIVAFARDEIMAYIAPESTGAKVIDVKDATTTLRDDLTQVIVDTTPTADEIREIVRETLEAASAKAAADGRTLSGDAAFEIVDATSGILESEDPQKADVRAALTEGKPTIAAGRLVSLASKQASDPTVSRVAAAETWREAGAILYSIDPAKSAEAYRTAASLSKGNTNYADLASQIEAELKRRETDDAAGARLIPTAYTGPIKSFPEAVSKDGVTVTPVDCRSFGLSLTCTFDTEFEGENRRISFEDIELLDDWARVFKPAKIVFGTRSITNNSYINSTLNGGKYPLVITFEGVPGGSTYGLNMVADGRLPMRWRNVPTDGLNTHLRDTWGGPMGMATFTGMNQEVELPPYGMRITGCERFGRRLSCFGQLGYEGPSQRVALDDVQLADTRGTTYKPSFIRLNSNTSTNSDGLTASLQTGLYDFEFQFTDVPVYSTYTLSGSVADTEIFTFEPFTLGKDDTLVAQRLAAFHDWPPRVDLGGSLRVGDFRVSPETCTRTEYSAVCEIGLIYVGAPARVSFDRINLVDHINNYYRPSKISLGTRNVTNTAAINTSLSAGEYVLSVAFDSIPKSRLFELQAVIGGVDELAVTNISLPAADGSLGVPSDITFYPDSATSRFGDVQMTAHGCAKRTAAIACYLEADYQGAARQVRFEDAILTTDSGLTIKPSAIRVAGRWLNNSDSAVTTLRGGIYPMYIEFQDVPEAAAYQMTMDIDRNGKFDWHLPVQD